jgi:hypothetical protein
LLIQEKKVEKPKELQRYTVRPPKDLRSKFILKMEARKLAEEQAEEEKQKAEAEQRQLVWAYSPFLSFLRLLAHDQANLVADV